MQLDRFCALKTLALAAAALATAAPAFADDLHWTGGAGDNIYSTAGNWDAGRSPTLGDNVYIFAPASTYIICDAGAKADYLISTASLVMDSFNRRLVVRGDADVFGDIVMSGNCTLSLGGEFRSWGGMTWHGGTIMAYFPTAPGSLSIKEGGSLQIGSTFDLILGAHLVNAGHVSHTAGAIRFEPFFGGATSPILTIGNAGSWESSGGTKIYEFEYGPGRPTVVINNAGWSFLGGSGPASIGGQTTFGNVGSLAVNGIEARIDTVNNIDAATGVLFKGNWSMYNGGRITSGSRVISEIDPEASVYIQGAGSQWDSLARLKTVRGTLMVDEGADVIVAPAFLDPLVNWGTVTVGAGAHLHVIGSYYQKPGATLRRIIDNTGESPRVGMLDTDLSISLAGEVTFEPYDSGKISAGEEFDLLGLAPLACCIVEGEFSTVTTLVPGHVRYEDRVATFVAGLCQADLNGDGLVDFADYLEFLNRFDAGDMSVDFNGDGLVDFSDYLEFLNLYDAGC